MQLPYCGCEPPLLPAIAATSAVHVVSCAPDSNSRRLSVVQNQLLEPRVRQISMHAAAIDDAHS